MSDAKGKDTALGVARARFVEGLSRKAAELKGALGLLTATPEADRPREEMRRRLHALYASAQVFRLEPLADALREAIRRLDAARDERRGLADGDLDALATLAATLPILASDHPISSAPPPTSGSTAPAPEPEASTASVRAPAGARIPSIAPDERALRRSSTLQGMPKSSPPPALVGAEPRRQAGTFTASVALRHEPGKHLETVISVLVVDGVEAQTQIRAALPPERFELLSASDPEEALRIARSSAPDVVLAERGLVLRPGVDLIGRLRNDPLTDFVPVVLLLPAGAPHDPVAVRETGADEAISKPIDPETLARTLARVSGDSSATGVGAALGDATLDEVADRVAFEVRRGLVSAAEQGGDMKIPLGEGAEVLAAAWSAIARMRAFVAQRSGGRVRFRDTPRRGGPAILALGEDADSAAEAATEVSLAGRRIIVADDDPAVVWFFAGILREEGADVVEAADGAEALVLARRRRPDLIVSDILMPNVDGFALLRELQREPALADVPVILLSWKEDYLQRMRELRAGATGYLRKEAGAAQILARVRDALRSRARLEAELRAGGEVRGRLERVGLLPLVETVARERPDARLTVRDAWNLFEIDFRGGTIVETTRTATDGSFARGDAALLAFLGSTAGRFTIVESDAPLRGSFHEPLSVLVGRAMSRLAALLDAVTGSGLVHAASVTFDREVLDAVVRTSPEPVRDLVARLSSGDGPRQLVISGSVAPQTLEAVLVDLVRRGALVGVRGPDGEDRVAVAAASRFAAEPPSTSPRAASAPPAAAAREEPQPEGLSWLKTEETTAEIVAETHRMAASGPPRQRDNLPELASSELVDDTSPGTLAAPAAAPGDSGETDAAPIALTRRSESPKPLASESPRPKSVPPPPPPRADAEPTEPPVVELAQEDEPTAPSASTTTSAAAADADASASKDESGAAQQTTHATEEIRTAPDDDGGLGAVVWITVLVALGVIGFFGWRYYADSREPVPDPPTAQEDVPGVPLEAPEAALPTGTTEPPVTDPALGAPEEMTVTDLRFGRIVPTILDAGVVVAPGQALLVVEVRPGTSGLRVRVDGRPVEAPLAIAVEPGSHAVNFIVGDRDEFRSARVLAGQTLVMTAPTP